jgi:hypothetical protein
VIHELKTISETLRCGIEDIQKERRVGTAHYMFIHIGEELNDLSEKLTEAAKWVFILEQWLEKKGIIIPLGELRTLQKEWENKIKA